MKAKVVVKSLILNRGLKKALLIRRCPKDEIGGDLWESAGGKVEEGETLEEAVIREIFEETGLNVVPERLLYASLDDLNGEKHVFMVYLCLTDREKVVLSSDEHTEYRWVDKEECKKLLQGGIAADYVTHGIYEMDW